MQEPGNAPPPRSSDSAAEPDAATEHIAPALLGSTCEASPGSDDMTINSLDDILSKLASEREESAVALCSAVRTLQRGAQAEMRNLCKHWGVPLTAKNAKGNHSKRGDSLLKSELTATFIVKAREHLRNKATETQQLQHAGTAHDGTRADPITNNYGNLFESVSYTHLTLPTIA